MTEWCQVKCFADDHPATRTANFGLRLTKKGRVNLRDVNRWIRGTRYKIPLRYYDGGVRKLNPDVGWPEDLLRHDTPEVYEGMRDVASEFLDNLTPKLLEISGHEWEEHQ